MLVKTSRPRICNNGHYIWSGSYYYKYRKRIFCFECGNNKTAKDIAKAKIKRFINGKL